MKLQRRIAMRRTLNRMFDVLPERLDGRVLFYHTVDPHQPGSLHPARFREHLRRLRALGYTFVKFQDVPRWRGRDALWICITFDDGYADNARHAAPILLEEGATATFFVVTNLVSDTRARTMSDDGHFLYPGREMLNAADVRWLHDSGMELGSHGCTHRLLSDLDEGELDHEIVHSKDRLEQITGAPVSSLAYPNGQRGAFSTRTEHVLGAAGYRTVATTLWGRPGTNALRVGRCEVQDTDTPDDVQSIVGGRRDYLAVVHRLRRGSELWDPRWHREYLAQGAS